MALVKLSKQQSERTLLLVSKFLERGRKSPVVSAEMLLLLQAMQGMVEDDILFEKVEFDVLVYIMECYFAAFESDDVDPLMEQSYCKLTGYWPEQFDSPWYDRVVTNASVVGYKEHKSSREPLGF